MNPNGLVTLSAHDLVELAIDYKELWYEIVGSIVEHNQFMLGEVISVEPYRFEKNVVRITIEFDVETRTFHSTSFGYYENFGNTEVEFFPGHFTKIQILKSKLDSFKIVSQRNKLEKERRISADQKEKLTNEKIRIWCTDFNIKCKFTLPKHAWPASDVFAELDAYDKSLAEIWANNDSANESTMARMLSARGAEKVAIKFYQALSCKVEDISITQMCLEKVNSSNNVKSEDWKLFDLLIDNETFIDVKNARISIANKLNYVEHCVSRFKETRNNEGIKIAGVLSPFYKFNDILHHDRITNDEEIYFLGETSVSDLLNLEKRFCRGALEVNLNNMNFIPRWTFDYPNSFYKNIDEVISYVIKSHYDNLPRLEQCIQNHFNPIPLFLLSGVKLPEIWAEALTSWQINFYEKFVQ